jgi:hypothetical protein
MAAQAQASNSQASLTHCMAGSNTCVGHKRGQSSGGDKQKQTADSGLQLYCNQFFFGEFWCGAKHSEEN